MEIEEAIKILKKAKKPKYTEVVGSEWIKGYTTTLGTEVDKAIEILLAEYEKEKRKNNKLFEGYNQRVSDILELEKKLEYLEKGDLTIVYMNGFFDGENKWKTKIKESQKKLNKEFRECNENDYETLNDITSQRKALTLLLQDKEE